MRGTATSFPSSHINLPNITLLMSTTLEIAPHALDVLERLESHGYEAYVVGGCVRDSLMQRIPLDWDICTNATPEQVLQVFKSYHTIKTGLQHGTVTVMVNKQAVEVTTYRLDGDYSDMRRPDSVTYVSDLREDLARRDFTINAMAYNPRQGLVDCFSGQEDLEEKIIRCVGNARERFEEDGLRIMRALRFASRFGFDIETHTALAMRELHPLLAHISVERIYKEFKGILVGKGAGSMLLSYTDIFIGILPEMSGMDGLDQKNPHHIYDVWQHSAHSVDAIAADEVLRLAALFHDCGKPDCFAIGEDGFGHSIGHAGIGAQKAENILRRLKSDNATIKRVSTLVEHHGDKCPTRRAGMRRWIGKFGEEGLEQLFELMHADIMAQSPRERAEKLAELTEARDLRDEVLALMPCFTVKDLSIGGQQLMELGVPAGPEIKQLLETLLNDVQNESLENSADALIKRAAALRAQASPQA